MVVLTLVQLDAVEAITELEQLEYGLFLLEERVEHLVSHFEHVSILGAGLDVVLDIVLTGL